MTRAFILLHGLLLLLPLWSQEVEIILPDTSFRVSSVDEVNSVLSSRLAHAGSKGRLGTIYCLKETQFHQTEEELALLFDVENRQVPLADTLLAINGGGVWLPHLTPFLRRSGISEGDILHSDGIPAWRVHDKSYFRYDSGYGVFY